VVPRRCGGVALRRPRWNCAGSFGAGLQEVFRAPQPQAGLSSERAIHSIRGPIAASWQQSASGFELSVTVPVNTIATVTIPTRTPSAVTEKGLPATSTAGVISSSSLAASLELVVGSGQYDFMAP
jgi:alpha-L-rhamnosidase